MARARHTTGPRWAGGVTVWFQRSFTLFGVCSYEYYVGTYTHLDGGSVLPCLLGIIVIVCACGSSDLREQELCCQPCDVQNATGAHLYCDLTLDVNSLL